MWQIFVSRQGQVGPFGKLCNYSAGCNTTTDSGSNGYVIGEAIACATRVQIRCFLNPLFCFGLFLLGQRVAFPEVAVVIALDCGIGSGQV
jgi:hypothetical protein